MGYSKETFGENEQKAFAAAIAKVAKVAPASVTVKVKEEQRRRRLLAVTAVEVEYVITTADVAAANSVKATIKAVGSIELMTEFKAAGLGEVTGATITVSDAVELVDDRVPPPPLPPPGVASPPPPSPPPKSLVEVESAGVLGADHAPRATATATFSAAVAAAAMLLFY